MELKFKVWYGDRLVTAALTTDAAESSYGQPVLVIDGEAFSPVDAAFSDIALAGGDDKIRRALAKAGYQLREEPWGLRLKRMRLERGITQVELAEKLGIPQPRVSDLEARKTPPRNAVLLRRIERILKRNCEQRPR